MVRQWKLDGTPRGLALGADGTLYVGLAGPQAVIAVDPETGAILARKTLDLEEIASTKDFVTLRTTARKDRLVIANGSDESVTILSLPDMAVLREIGVEGEMVRDALPAPDGAFVALLGRDVHIWSRDGKALLHVLKGLDPMAIAVSSDGKTLAVIGRETFPSGTVSVAVMFETGTWTESGRRPLQTDRTIRGAQFAAGDSTLLVWADDWLAEAPLAAREGTLSSNGSAHRMSLGFGDLVSSEVVCLPKRGGPQSVVMKSDTSAIFAERRCASSGSMTGARRVLKTASLLGVEPWAIAWDERREWVIATDPEGTVTIYRPPAPPPVR